MIIISVSVLFHQSNVICNESEAMLLKAEGILEPRTTPRPQNHRALVGSMSDYYKPQGPRWFNVRLLQTTGPSLVQCHFINQLYRPSHVNKEPISTKQHIK